MWSCANLAHGDFIAPIASQAPKLDGLIEDGEWAGAVQIDGFGADRRRARGYVMATQTHLHLAIRSQLPVKGELLADVDRDNTPKMVFDDSVEIWIDPWPNEPNGRKYQFMTNLLNRRWAKMHPRGTFKGDVNWKPEWQVAGAIHGEHWHCEIAIPIAELTDRSAAEGTWHVDLWRNWKRPWKQAFMGKTVWQFTEDPGPVFRLEERGDRFRGRINLALVAVNPTDEALEVNANLTLERDVMPEVIRKQTLAVAPGKSAELVLELIDDNTQKHQFFAEVRDGDDRKTLFSHRMGWKYGGPWEWITHKKELPPVDFLFAYYPSHDRMRLQADVSNMPKDATVERVVATVREKQTRKPVKSIVFDRFEEGRQEQTFSLPPLDGDYEIALKARGQNVPDAERVKPFIRYRYEWEGKGYGKTTKVHPPFEPMRVNDLTVATVLREHTVNDVGLWSQVVAEAQNTGVRKPILQSPMRYLVQAGGKRLRVKGAGVEFATVADHEVRGKAGFSAGPLAAEAALLWEYDGMLRIDLTLAPTGGEAIDGLQLEIPLDFREATHFHAMGDGLRNTISEQIPRNKTGVVWDASKVAAADLPENFCSYIYVGSPRRGVCWFAENDLNWGWDRSKPNLELVRAGGATILRVHLINQPTVIEAPRTITFGLQAAPIKPRLHNDRWRLEYQRRRCSILGTCVNWGSLDGASSVYPAGKDTLIWKMIAESNVRHLSKEEIEATVDHYRPYVKPYESMPHYSGRYKSWADAVLNHIRHNTGGARHGKTMIYYYNRSCHMLEDEFQTFMDEWGLHDWRPDYKAQGKGDLGEIKIVPSETYMDFAQHWYIKSFELGRNQGVYWDNMFFRPSYNAHTTAAYRTAQGDTVPAAGLWGLRELVKRTFQMMSERGMDPLTMPHMTSTMILPMYAFATIIYDLEWKYGQGDMQDKFTPEYFLMITNGELAGAWPILLGDRGGTRWTDRTYTAATLVHDVYWAQGRGGGVVMRPVAEMLEQPGAKVFRYWDEGDLPVGIRTHGMRWIAVGVPGKRFVVVITNFSQKQSYTPMTLNLQVMGMEKGCRVRDWELHRVLPDRDGVVGVPGIAPHDAAIIEIDAQ